MAAPEIATADIPTPPVMPTPSSIPLPSRLPIQPALFPSDLPPTDPVAPKWALTEEQIAFLAQMAGKLWPSLKAYWPHIIAALIFMGSLGATLGRVTAPAPEPPPVVAPVDPSPAPTPAPQPALPPVSQTRVATSPQAVVDPVPVPATGKSLTISGFGASDGSYPIVDPIDVQNLRDALEKVFRKLEPKVEPAPATKSSSNMPPTDIDYLARLRQIIESRRPEVTAVHTAKR